MAKHFAMIDPPNAAGGCLLTDPAFSKRIKDMMVHCDDIPSLNDVELLKIGRHFRLSGEAKLIVGRNMGENELVRALVIRGDLLIESKDCVGPTCILRCKKCDVVLLKKSASIVLRYSDAPKDVESKVKIVGDNGVETEIEALPADSSEIDSMRI
jgi:hypothetical protein